MISHSQHTYTNLHHTDHNPDPEDSNAAHHTCTTFSTCLHACVGSFVKVLCYYIVCAVLNVFDLIYKQMILYWCALIVCVMLSLCCVPCASVVLLMQACVGVVLYLSWFNILNLWEVSLDNTCTLLVTRLCASRGIMVSPPTFCFVFGLYTITQVTLHLQQERIQVERSNKVVRRLPTESNSTPAMDIGHECCCEVMYLYVGGGCRHWNGHLDYYSSD